MAVRNTRQRYTCKCYQRDASKKHYSGKQLQNEKAHTQHALSAIAAIKLKCHLLHCYKGLTKGSFLFWAVQLARDRPSAIVGTWFKHKNSFQARRLQRKAFRWDCGSRGLWGG